MRMRVLDAFGTLFGSAFGKSSPETVVGDGGRFGARLGGAGPSAIGGTSGGLVEVELPVRMPWARLRAVLRAAAAVRKAWARLPAVLRAAAAVSTAEAAVRTEAASWQSPAVR